MSKTTVTYALTDVNNVIKMMDNLTVKGLANISAVQECVKVLSSAKPVSKKATTENKPAEVKEEDMIVVYDVNDINKILMTMDDIPVKGLENASIVLESFHVLKEHGDVKELEDAAADKDVTAADATPETAEKVEGEVVE